MQLLLQHIKTAEHKKPHSWQRQDTSLIHPLTTCNIQTNCTKSSHPRTTAPSCTSEPTIITHSANAFAKPMAHHILSAKAKINRRRNTAKQTQHSHIITTAHTTFLALLIIARSIDKRPTTSNTTPKRRRPSRMYPIHRGPSTNLGPKQTGTNN